MHAAPLPIVIIILLWLLIFGWTAYELSTHKFGLLFSPGSMVSAKCLVQWQYWMTLASFL